MKKKLLFNLAALMVVATELTSQLARIPQSLFFLGAPTEPLKKIEE